MSSWLSISIHIGREIEICKHEYIHTIYFLHMRMEREDLTAMKPQQQWTHTEILVSKCHFPRKGSMALCRSVLISGPWWGQKHKMNRNTLQCQQGSTQKRIRSCWKNTDPTKRSLQSPKLEQFKKLNNDLIWL